VELIEFQHVIKSYEKGIRIIDNLNLSIRSGEFITLIGPSGCGKTTLLKLINGLIKPEEGKIFVKGREINAWNLIELRRNIGYVIQQIGLFPHMNVEDNIGYILNIKKVAKAERTKRAKELMALVGIKQEYLSKYPRELSGGQKQRVGVARALAADPDIILMDEPFGAVDEITRRILQDEILSLQKNLKKTIIFVTHDIEEAFKLGSRMILFDKGQIIQSGTKKEMLFNSQNKFVRNFFGLKNFTAYLNVTKIMEVMFPVPEQQDFLEKDSGEYRNNLVIKYDASLMEGIKELLEHGRDCMDVVGNNHKVIGEFSLNHLKQMTNSHYPIVNHR
jgi:osmoprotectant transport system ATP-binding protein